MTGIDARVKALEARASRVADARARHEGARERLAEMLRGMRERADATMTDEERERAEAGSGRSVAEWVALLTRKAAAR